MYIIRNENKEKLESLPYFNLMAMRQLFDYNEATARQTLTRWSRSGRIIRLKKDLYISRDFYLAHKADPDFPGFISAVIQPFSYLSLDYVLQTYSILTETTFPVTGVTTKNTQSVTNKFGLFNYCHIQSDLFGGYEEKTVFGVRVNQASLGKALFDYFYFRPAPAGLGMKDYGVTEDWRLNLEEFTAKDIKEWEYWVKKSGLNKMKAIAKNFKETMWK